MRKFNLLLTVTIILMILTLSFTSAGAQAPADEGIGANVLDDPAPIYPDLWESVFTKTPTFRFTQYNDVTKYRITVRNGYDENIVYYTYKGTATCWDGECKLTPDIALTGGVVTYLNDTKGYYQWTVQAKEGPGMWTPVQTFVDFMLGTSGFSSSFNVNKNNWVDANGEWLLTTKGQLKNSGITGEYTSALFKKRINDNFTYTIMMKLKSVDARHFGGLIFNGNGLLYNPVSYPTEKNVWYHGIYVVYRNDQKAAIFVWQGGANTGGLPWTTCSSIVPGGWNEIEVTTEVDTMYVKINDTPCLTFTHPMVEETGYVGLTQYRYSAETEKMLVDWATLEVDTP